MSLTLKQKIFLGYAVMISFTVIVGLYAIWSLNALNKITETVVYHDVAAQEKLTKLNDSILAQDLYEKRYLAFQDIDAEKTFWKRSSEFRSLIVEATNISPSFQNILDDISVSHENYNTSFKKEADFIKKRHLKEAENISSTEVKDNLDRILLLLKDLELKLKALQTLHISESSILGGRALIITVTLSIASLMFGALFAYLIANYLTSSIEKLKDATYSIRSGNFDRIPEIKGADELADLAISFKEMTARLKELEAVHLDANPLTKLPGNLAIEKELLTRLNENEKFSFCLIDLDNFKAFSDRYGFAKGSDILKWLGDMLLEIMKTAGTNEDFLGHIGGDDFVIICAPERMESICSRIIEEFDKGIKQHYEPEDLERGYIVSLDRNNKPAVFPIMTISIAVVNTDRTVIKEPREVAEKVAELKQYAKTFPRSIYVVDRRRSR